MANDVGAEVALSTGDFFLARQPILGRNQHLVAFELLFRTDDVSDANVTDGAAATAAVISHASQLGLEKVIGDRIAFVNVDEVVLMSDFVRFLPHDKVILEILETVRATPDVVQRVQELKQVGFKFALDDVVSDSADVCTLRELVDVIKIDVKGVAQDRLARLTQRLNAPGQKLLAEKVETVEEFHHCLELGFDYFQGYYFARPAILTGRKINPSELVVLRLLELLRSDAEDAEIERSVKRDPVLAMNLLRLVNTPVSGTHRRIDSLGEALAVMGRERLQRWLEILLYAKPGDHIDMDSPLLQMATTRGRLMELMIQRVRPDDDAAAASGFTTGVMSLMDALFCRSMEDILETVAVPDEVRTALLERTGQLGELLRIVELVENPKKGSQLGKLLKQQGLTVKQVREIEVAAFAWVGELAHEVAQEQL
jgi:EAL and modified HD-GYP domain-containing signal transduction protein